MMMLKFEFSLTTRNGQKVEHIVIAGKDQQDAERKLFQMYPHCVILSCEVKYPDGVQGQAPDIEKILTLISK